MRRNPCGPVGRASRKNGAFAKTAPLRKQAGGFICGRVAPGYLSHRATERGPVPTSGQPPVTARFPESAPRSVETYGAWTEGLGGAGDMSGVRPDMSRDRPDMSRDRPDMSRDRPDMSRDRPDMSRDRPDMSGDRSDMCVRPCAAVGVGFKPAPPEKMAPLNLAP
jgi:hypothetical protein